MLKYRSVCSGIKAVSVAWECLGFKPLWFSEIEPFPCAVLAHLWISACTPFYTSRMRKIAGISGQSHTHTLSQ